MTEHADEISIPALLRAARGAYAQSVSEHLIAEGFDDVPRNGPFVLSGMTNWEAPAADLVGGLGVTRQAASQLIDTLVLRGYLIREANQDDRRRITITLTARGRAAGEAVRAAVRVIDEQLAARIEPAQLAGLRAGLAALAEITHERRATLAGAS
ncbi:MAG: MarR family winged helix-turn-helix transcriptional regulator [Labedaea sp.]